MPARHGRPRSLPVTPTLTLAQKLAFAIGGVMVLVLLVTWWVIQFNVDRLLRQQAESAGLGVTRLLAQTVAEPLLADDRLQLALIAESLTGQQAVRAVSLYNARGQQVAGSAGAEATSAQWLQRQVGSLLRDEAAQRLHVVERVIFHGQAVGFVHVQVDAARLEKPLRQSLQRVALASILMMALACVAAYFLGRWLARPIDRLAEATRALREGRYERLINQPRDDEIGQVIGTLNDMANALHRKQHSERTLARYVSPAVASELLGGDADRMQGRLVEATPVFIDMVGFTGLSERMPPHQVAAFLNVYFRLLNRCAKLWQGNVDKYMGDGAMLVFGVPQADAEHGLHALCFARLFTQLAEALNERRPAGWPVVAFRVGLHSGEMIAGAMGSADRMQYTVVGDAVNLAARLGDIGPGNAVLLSEDLLRRSEVRGRIEVRRFDNVRLKGKSQDTVCYQLLSLADPLQSLVDRQVEHLLAEVDWRV